MADHPVEHMSNQPNLAGAKRKRQLRDAQRRLRQRKQDQLQEANKEIQMLRHQIANANALLAISMVSDQAHSDPFAQQGPDPVGTTALAATDENVVRDNMRPLIESHLLEPLHEVDGRRLLGDSWSQPEFMDFDLLAEPDAGLLLDLSEGTNSVSSVSPAAYDDLVIHHVHPSRRICGTFAQKLNGKCFQLITRMLDDPNSDINRIQRVFGNTFDHVSKADVMAYMRTGMKSQRFEDFELYNYPAVRFRTDNPDDTGDSSPEIESMAGGTYMSARDIERYCLWNGLLRQEINEDDSTITSITKTCPFEYKGRRWIIDEPRLITILSSTGVCLGRAPGFLVSDMTMALFQSMSPFTIE